MQSVVMRIEGLDPAIAGLRTLASRDAKAIVRKGVRAGAKIVLAAEKAEAPVRQDQVQKRNSRGRFLSYKKSRTMLNSLAVGGKRGPKGLIAMGVGPRTSAYPGPYVPAFVIYGHRIRHSSARAKANDFITRAFNRSREAAAQAAADVIESGIAAALS